MRAAVVAARTDLPAACRPIVDAAFLNDPYPAYRELREAGPIHWSEEFFGGAWLLTRHEDVESVLRDPVYSARRTGGWVMRGSEEARQELCPFQRLFSRAMLFLDAPDHTRLRQRRHNRRLYRLARATLRDGTEAEDALQAAYLSAYRSIGRFRGDATLLTWLSRLVLNECYGRLRREARRQNVIPMTHANTHVDIDDMTAQDSDSPDKALARAELRALLERRLDELPEVFRVVFVLRSVEELSVEETAQCLDIPEATVRSRHFRARSLLRESLAHEIDLAERDVFEFGGAHCDRVVANVLSRVAGEDGKGSGSPAM